MRREVEIMLIIKKSGEEKYNLSPRVLFRGIKVVLENTVRKRGML